MKTIKKSFGALALVVLSFIGLSCEEKPVGPVIAQVPFSSIAVDVDGEHVEGVVDGETITFTIKKALDLTNGTLSVEINEGWEMTYPSSLTGYDLTAEDIDLYFQDLNKNRVSYAVVVVSESNPVSDPSKITSGELKVNTNIANSEIVITWTSELAFNYNTNQDPRTAIEISLDGALREGATVKGSTTFDLSKGASKLVIEYNGNEFEFALRIDYTAKMESYSSWGFEDLSETYSKDGSIKVYKATSLSKNVPAANPDKEANEWWDKADNQLNRMAILADYERMGADKTYVEANETELFVVLLDKAAFKGDLASNEEKSVAPGTITGDVVMSAEPNGHMSLYQVDNKVLGNQIQWADNGPWRSGIAFDSDGNMTMGFYAYKSEDKKFHTMPFFEFTGAVDDKLTDSNLLPRKKYTEHIGAVMTQEDIACGKPYFVMNGRKLGFKEVTINDGFTETLGPVNSAGADSRRYCFIGTTYDGKIALAAQTKSGISAIQAAYVLEKLGWDNVLACGNSSWQADQYVPSIYIDGKSLSTNESAVNANFVIRFNKKK